MYCQQSSKLSIPSARPKAGGEGLLCRHQEPPLASSLLCTGVTALQLQRCGPSTGVCSEAVSQHAVS